MTQIPDEAAERVLGAIREVIDLDAQGEIEDAEQLLRPLVDEFPETSLLHSYMAWVLSRSGKHREAIEHGRVAVKLSPDSEMSSIMLFRAFWNAGEHLQALEEMKRLEKYGHSEEYTRMMQEWNEGKKDGESERIQ
ncbi:MAG TPA: tetratricopeptide repeat protein [Terracidiphilus sp.]|jgi:predicted Zn-dependent protease|nr:tetratricopeptide repeat protein [Terracidiphilus sp.]